MSTSDPEKAERLRRMRAMFAVDGAIYVADYEYFTGVTRPDEPTHRNRDSRKSGELTEPQDPEQN